MSVTKEEYYSPTRVDAACTALVSDDVVIVDALGPVFIGLTVVQAEYLLASLTQAIAQAKEVYAELNKYMSQENTPNE